MSWRKWLIRSLVYSFVVGLVVLYVLYQFLTNPTATRRKVLDKLGDRFLGATISLESARLNLLDGISMTELRMARRDDLDKNDFLYVPSGVIYHDKEQILDGKLALRKIVLNRPQLRILIERNGSCNLLGLMAPVDPNERMPILVIQQGTIVLEDRRLGTGKPLLEIRNLDLTILNDPLPQLIIDGVGQTDVLGALQFHAESQRAGGACTATLELPSISVGPLLVQRLAEFVPDLGVHLRYLKANGKMQVSFSWQPGASSPLGLTVAGKFNDGQFIHARLPHTLEQIEASFECVNGPPPLPAGSAGSPVAGQDSDKTTPALLNLRFPSIHVSAVANSAHLEATIKDLAIPRLATPGSFDKGGSAEAEAAEGPRPQPATLLTASPRNNSEGSQHGQPSPPSRSLLVRFEEEWPLRELTYKIEHLAVTPDLFRYLPESLQSLKEDYKPCGPVTVTHHYERPRPGKWSKQFLIQPEGMEAEFSKFPYPLHHITGTIERTEASDQADRFRFDLAGYGGDRPLTFKGTTQGEKAIAAIDFEIAANNVPLDERLLRALPPRQQALASQFHPEGLADVKVSIKRPYGSHEFGNRYVVSVHDAALNYDVFPFRLQQVSGVLEIFPDHWECRDFHATHPAAEPSRDFCDVEAALKEQDGVGGAAHLLARNGGTISVQGRSYPATPEQVRNGLTGTGRVHLLIQGKDVQVNKEFEAALAPPSIPARAALQRTWRTLAMGGRMSFNAEVLDVPGQPKDIDVSVSLRGCSMKPKFFDYTLNDLIATVHYAHDQVDVQDVQARHGSSQLAFKQGRVLLRPEDGFQVRIGDPQPGRALGRLTPGLVATGLVVDAAFLAALPPALRKGLAALKLQGPVDLQTNLVIDQKDAGKGPVIWWDGGVALPANALLAGVEVKDIHGAVATCGRFDGQQLEGVVGTLVLDKATILGQPVSNVKTQVEVAPDSPQTLRFRNLSTQFYGGQLGGEARVELSPKFGYDFILYGTGIQLEQFGQHNLGASSEIKGPAMVAVHLSGTGTELVDLKGHGQFDVPSGKLYRLPLVLDLIKAIGLRTPDGTAFEQVHMAFAIENGKLVVPEMNLLGHAISLRGQGSVNLDGSHVNLDFNADWGGLGMFPDPVTALPRYFSDQILKIKVRGRIGDVRFEREYIPGVVEPFRKMLGKGL